MDQISKNKSNDIKKPLFFAAAAASIAFIGLCAILRTRDPDTLWIIATGNEILQNGILHTNPFTIDDIGIVVQQWLSDVIFALFAQIGHIGNYIFACVNVAVLGAASYLYFSHYKINHIYKALFMTAVCACVMSQHASTRPEIMTAAFLFLTCYAMERYLRERKTAALILLPVLIFLEANIHSSMIWFHFAVIITYIIPPFSKKICNGIFIKGRLKPILLFTALSAGVMFINPYGADGVMYLPRSLFAGTFDIINIFEMSPLFSTDVFYISMFFVLLVPTVYLMIRRRAKNYQVYMTAGAAVLTLFSMRNIIFMIIPAFCSLFQIMEEVVVNNNRVKKERDISYTFRMLVIIFALIILDICSICIELPEETNSARKNDVGYAESMESFDEMASIDAYIRDNCDDVANVKLFTGFNVGAFFEYLGYKNIYIDARPELFMKDINGTKDILPTYATVSFGEADEVSAIAPEFLNEYDFDYLVVSEEGILDYLDTEDTDYVPVASTKVYHLYEKREMTNE